jgi:hypothetical protein
MKRLNPGADVKRCLALLVACAPLALVGPSSALADFPSGAPDRFLIVAGGTAATLGTGVALGRNEGALSKMLVFEDFFNIPIHSQFARIESSWKFGGRHYLDVGYVSIDRSGARQADTDFAFGNYTFHAGARVEGSFDSQFLYTAYRYDFLQEDKVRISGSAGISAERLAAGVTTSAGATDSNGNAVNGEVSQSAQLSLPVPLVGLQLDWALSPKFELETHSRLFSLAYNNFRGSQIDSAVRLYWLFHRNAGIGAGYDKASINMPQFSSGGQTMRFAYNIEGLSLYLRGSF